MTPHLSPWEPPPLTSRTSDGRELHLNRIRGGVLQGDGSPWTICPPYWTFKDRDRLLLPNPDHPAFVTSLDLKGLRDQADLFLEVLASRSATARDVIALARRLGARPGEVSAFSPGEVSALARLLMDEDLIYRAVRDIKRLLNLILQAGDLPSCLTLLLGRAALKWSVSSCAVDENLFSMGIITATDVCLNWRWLEAVLPGGGVRFAWRGGAFRLTPNLGWGFTAVSGGELLFVLDEHRTRSP